MRRSTTTATLILASLYVLHQDVWFWNEARPLVFGFLPIGLFYHTAFTAATSLVLLWLVRILWPAHLDDERAGVGRGLSAGRPDNAVATHPE